LTQSSADPPSRLSLGGSSASLTKILLTELVSVRQLVKAPDDIGGRSLCRENPEIVLVHELHYSPYSEQRHILEARLLTTESYEEISQRMGTSAKAVSLYADLFFDVRDRLQARDWIMKVILGPLVADDVRRER
jgi:hypothetical protein